MSKSLYIFLLASAIVYMGSPFKVNGQEFRANVTVNMEQIPIDQREDIMSMERDVASYVNNQSFTGEQWDTEPITVNLSIFLMSRQGDNYQARLVMTAQRPLLGSDGAQSLSLQIYEEEWFFPYSRNAVLGYTEGRFDHFSSTIDFYLFLALGMDFDTFGELDGTYYYEQAFEIWQLGSTQNALGYALEFEPGEITKYTLVKELTNPRYEDFRKLVFSYYVDGLDLLNEEPATAYQGLEHTFKDMVKFKDGLVGASSLMQAWFDFKHDELAEIFRDYENRALVLKMLNYLDPGHSSTYIEALGG